jgi:hypothetical protein
VALDRVEVAGVGWGGHQLDVVVGDYALAAKVYQQDIDLSDESMDALERVMGCSLDGAYELLGGRLGRARRARVSVPNLYPATKKPSGLGRERIAEGSESA